MRVGPATPGSLTVTRMPAQVHPPARYRYRLRPVPATCEPQERDSDQTPDGHAHQEEHRMELTIDVARGVGEHQHQGQEHPQAAPRQPDGESQQTHGPRGIHLYIMLSPD